MIVFYSEEKLDILQKDGYRNLLFGYNDLTCLGLEGFRYLGGIELCLFFFYLSILFPSRASLQPMKIPIDSN